MPQNFLIDPVATSVDDALGVAIDEFVSRHHVEQLQEQGIYREGYIGNAPSDTDLEPDQDLSTIPEDKVRLTKYYGLGAKGTPRRSIDEDIEEENAMLRLISCYS